MGNSKLHEVLAVEADLEGKAKVIITETKKVFSEKPALFTGYHKSYHPLVEGGIQLPEENQSLTTTVDDKLQYLAKSVAAWLDVVAQKEATNQVAKADLVVGELTLAANVPATLLLGLESRLKQVRVVYEGIPTLTMGADWQSDEAKGKNVFSMVHPEETIKTAKVPKSKVLYEATKEHPAQIKEWTEDEAVGRWTKRSWSGMITPARKAVLLERIDVLLRAVKTARQRANNTEVVKTNVGKVLLDFINKE